MSRGVYDFQLDAGTATTLDLIPLDRPGRTTARTRTAIRWSRPR
ncbi:MAG TPA: hypothetical protein VE196_07020 [Pseudonocardiaceae bacterium]|nr:hypothetical protein [Pseudonocardiaceae bacterium]